MFSKFGCLKDGARALVARFRSFVLSISVPRQGDPNAINISIERLRSLPRYQDKKCLTLSGHKVYSQCDEDGIIREIFQRIGLTNKMFVEFGVGDGLENNTLALLFDGWQGVWIEGSDRLVGRIREGLKNTIECGRLQLINDFVTRDNINSLISTAFGGTEIDLLAIDIDGNDFHVFESITCINPRVVVIEYNAKFHPPMQYCMSYEEGHKWSGDDHFGASLKFLEEQFSKKGYCLVGCSLSGANAFFVREDLVADRFMEPYTAEAHYEPARYFLGKLTSGQKPSYKTLDRSMVIRGR